MHNTLTWNGGAVQVMIHNGTRGRLFAQTDHPEIEAAWDQAVTELYDQGWQLADDWPVATDGALDAFDLLRVRPLRVVH